jgi:hypothetical protein
MKASGFLDFVQFLKHCVKSKDPVIPSVIHFGIDCFFFNLTVFEIEMEENRGKTVTLCVSSLKLNLAAIILSRHGTDVCGIKCHRRW